MKRLAPLFTLFFALTLLAACSGETETTAEKAQRLAQEFIIVDGHVDLPSRLSGGWENVSQRTPDGDIDFVRAREGGLDAPFMSIYVSTRYQDEAGAAYNRADTLIDLVERIASEWPDQFAIATTPDQIRQHHEEGLVSLPMGMENGAGIEDDLANLQYFYDRGIRYITLTHGEDNLIGDSSYDDSEDTHDGLSDYGREVVREMNRLGIMVDVSHITDETFWDVMEVTEAPVIASHSSARHFTPGFERNMGDSLIAHLPENGGVIMINFGSAFLDSASANSGDRVQQAISDSLEAMGLDRSSDEGRQWAQQYYNENYQFSDVEMVANHIDHVVELAGVDYVGLGSDWDGVGNTLPEGLKSPAGLPNLIAELLERGYTEEEIEKICSGNVFRVWEQVIQTAEEMQSSM
ncbi:MAG: dipeptidase [Balneolaceae bacterium]|nr:dipeptidase [Balneolaceae bacterium]